MRARAVAVLVAMLAAACYDAGESNDAPAPGAAEPPVVPAVPAETATVGPDLVVTARAHDESTATTGRVAAIADLGARAIAFGARAVAAIADESVATSAAVELRWTSAAAVAAADGNGRWGVGTHDGKLVRLRDDRTLEDVGGRFGLGPADLARAVAAAHPEAFVVGLDQGIVVVNVAQARTTRFDVGPVDQVATSNDGRVLAVTAGKAWTLDIASGKRTNLDGNDVRGAAFDGTTVLVATEHGLARESERRDGSMRSVLRREDVAIGAITTSGGRAWFTAGTELWALEGGAVRRVSGVVVAPGSALAAAEGGDVWLLGDVLTRLRPQVPPAEAAWVANVLPVVQDVCRECHAPGRSSGIDLTTMASWNARRPALLERVLDKRTMPPPPASLTDAQREGLRRWLTAP